DDVTGLILLPLAAKALTIPYIASGGFGDGTGLAAALALGAEGVNMGTRFLCTQEAPIHNNIKEQMNKVSMEVVALEQQPGGVEFPQIAPIVSGQRGKLVYELGDPDHGIWTAGQIVGLIKDIPTCDVLVKRIVQEAEDTIKGRLESMIVTEAKL
ncbi:hypothetical protein BGZ76_004294, partial [Entomortierella beljakovae]